MRKRGIRRKDDRGAAAVEFALVLIPLMLIIVSMINFGQAFFTQISLDHAAREGVRVAALGGTDYASVATTAANGVTGLGTVTSSAACVTGDASTTKTVTVTVPDTLTFWFPYPGFSTINLQGKGVAKCYT